MHPVGAYRLRPRARPRRRRGRRKGLEQPFFLSFFLSFFFFRRRPRLHRGQRALRALGEARSEIEGVQGPEGGEDAGALGEFEKKFFVPFFFFLDGEEKERENNLSLFFFFQRKKKNLSPSNKQNRTASRGSSRTPGTAPWSPFLLLLAPTSASSTATEAPTGQEFRRRTRHFRAREQICPVCCASGTAAPPG